MSISNDNRIAGPFIGNDTTTVLPFNFKVFAATDLVVTKTNTSTGVTTTLVLNSDYTASVNANQDSTPGGTVTLSAALATGYTSVVTSSLANLQPMVLTNLGGFLPTVINDMADRVTILIQQLASKIGNAIRAPLTDGNIDMTLPPVAQRANTFCYFNASGQPIASSGVSSTAISAAMTPVVQASTSAYGAQLLLQGNVASAANAFTGTNVLEQSTYSANSYVQDITQNTNAGATASTDIIVANNLGTDTTYYGNFGINSSGFTGSGSLNKTNAVYLTATSGDLVVGTTTANAIRFVYNGATTDAAYIDSTGLNAANILASSSMKLNGSPVFDKINIRKFTSSGTYTPTTGMAYCVIECWGGGGAGGSIAGSASNSGGAGGGGAGGYSRKIATAAQIGGSQIVTIGAGGSPGSAGNNPGGAGGTTSVGSLCIANGGTGGSGSPGGTAPGGAGGGAGTGDLTIVGQNGQCGNQSGPSYTTALGGPGGSSQVGSAGLIPVSGGNATAGGDASGYAAGGAGASANGTTSTAAGGSGSPGFVVITEYVSV